jgi:hypothetical protein
MAYEKAALGAIGGEIVDMIQALADGVDAEDAGVVVGFLTKAVASIDAIKSDPDAAILDILSGAASAAADLRRDVVEAP